jgi:hypothetical protein
LKGEEGRLRRRARRRRRKKRRRVRKKDVEISRGDRVREMELEVKQD